MNREPWDSMSAYDDDLRCDLCDQPGELEMVNGSWICDACRPEEDEGSER